MRLTKVEKTWLDRIQALLDNPPSRRLGFYTIGDPDIFIYDRRKDAQIGDIMDQTGYDWCQCVNKIKAGADTCLRFPANVASTAG